MAKTPFSLSEIQDRQDRVRGWMAKSGVDAALFTSPAAITYLTGTESGRPRDSALLLTQIKTELLPDTASVVDALKPMGSSLKRLGTEFDSATLRLRKLLLDSMASLDLADMGSAVRRLRLVKSADEIKLLTKLAQIGQVAMAQALKRLGAGAYKDDVSFEILSLMHREVSKLGPDADLRAHEVSITESGPKAEAATISLVPSYAGYAVPLRQIIAQGKAGSALMEFEQAHDQLEGHLRKLLRPGGRSAEIASVLDAVLAEKSIAGIKPGQFGRCVTGLRDDGNTEATLSLSKSGELILQPGMLVQFEPAAADVKIPSAARSSLYLITEGQPRLLAGIVRSSTTRAVRGKARKTT